MFPYLFFLSGMFQCSCCVLCCDVVCVSVVAAADFVLSFFLFSVFVRLSIIAALVDFADQLNSVAHHYTTQ